MSAPLLHRYISFYQTDSILAFAVNGSGSGSALVIDRATAAFSLQRNQPLPCLALLIASSRQCQDPSCSPANLRNHRPHSPSIGYAHFHSSSFGWRWLIHVDTYVILISGRESVGHLTSHEIWRLTKFEIVPLRLGNGNTIQDPDEAGFIHLISHHFTHNTFYFSYTYDLTSNLERNSQKPANAPFFDYTDDRFYWNKFLQTPLIDFRNASPSNGQVDGFILPMIFGFVRIQHTFVNHKALTVALISRRSRFRVGTRYFSRGIDEAGHVANFNETEQLVLVPGATKQLWMSYVQTRGSIPVYWAEVNDLKYKPKLRVLSKIDKSV
jgi:SacI homology domain